MITHSLWYSTRLLGHLNPYSLPHQTNRAATQQPLIQTLHDFLHQRGSRNNRIIRSKIRLEFIKDIILLAATRMIKTASEISPLLCEEKLVLHDVLLFRGPTTRRRYKLATEGRNWDERRVRQANHFNGLRAGIEFFVDEWRMRGEWRAAISPERWKVKSIVYCGYSLLFGPYIDIIFLYLIIQKAFIWLVDKLIEYESIKIIGLRGIAILNFLQPDKDEMDCLNDYY